MATHSSVPAWRIPGTGEPSGLPSNGVAQSWTRLKRLSSSSGKVAGSQTHRWQATEPGFKSGLTPSLCILPLLGGAGICKD